VSNQRRSTGEQADQRAVMNGSNTARTADAQVGARAVDEPRPVSRPSVGASQ